MVSVRIESRSASPGGSIVLNRNATRPRPFTRPGRSTAVTTPDTAVPAGSAWTPSAMTARRKVPRTASSTRLESDATAVVSSTGRTVPAASVTSRYSGTAGFGAAVPETPAEPTGRSEAVGVTAAGAGLDEDERPGAGVADATAPPATGAPAGGCAGTAVLAVSARSARISARAISLRPAAVSTTTCSG